MDLIHGVKIKNLKAIHDDRGFLMEMLRNDDGIFEKFGQVYMTGVKYGVAKGFHYHKMQTDHFSCVYGTALVVLYDARENSPTKGVVNEFILGAPGSDKGQEILVKIPIGVFHGFTAYECDEARIVNVPTKEYNYKEPDEYRCAWNSDEVAYKWPDYVKMGG